MITKQAVFSMLESVGVCPDDKVTVHTSLKAIGPIEGGAEGLLDALREYLCDGLLIVPTHTWLGILERPYYDRDKTTPCIGVLPTVAAFHPAGIRSFHPTHSVAVFGKNAADYVAQEKTYTTGTPEDHCLSRLYREHGKILLLGVGFESNTYIHSVEEILNIPDRISEEVVQIGMKDATGQIKTVPFRGHAVAGMTYSISDHYPVLEKPFFAMGALTYSVLGSGKVICCDAYKTAKAYAYLRSAVGYDFIRSNEEISEEYYSGVVIE